MWCWGGIDGIRMGGWCGRSHTLWLLLTFSVSFLFLRFGFLSLSLFFFMTGQSWDLIKFLILLVGQTKKGVYYELGKDLIVIIVVIIGSDGWNGLIVDYFCNLVQRLSIQPLIIAIRLYWIMTRNSFRFTFRFIFNHIAYNYELVKDLLVSCNYKLVKNLLGTISWGFESWWELYWFVRSIITCEILHILII